jgi:hypothetical protein
MSEVAFGIRVLAAGGAGLLAIIGGATVVDTKLIENDGDVNAARQKVEEQMRSLPPKEQANFVDAKLASINCPNAATQTPMYIDLPSGGPERERIMGLLNNGTCRVELRP